jgi:uncharacterized protein YkwD
MALQHFLSSKLSLAAMVALVVAAIGIAAAQDATAAGQCAVVDSGLDAEERAFVDLVNGYREEAGLGPLTVSTTLTRAAAWMATDLGQQTAFGHIDSLGRSAHVRIADCGYGGPAGENLAAGKTWETAARAMRAWQESPDHNRNMLHALYVQVGVARVYTEGSRYGWYWATTFGTVDDGTNMLPQAAAPAATAQPAETAAAVEFEVRAGANLVAWPGATFAARNAFTGFPGFTAVYAYDAATGEWLRFVPGAPDYVNTLSTLENGRAYWMMASRPGVWSLR